MLLAAAGRRMIPSLAARALSKAAGDPFLSANNRRTPQIFELLFSRWCCPAGNASTLPEGSGSWRGRSLGAWKPGQQAGDEASRRKRHTWDSGDHLVRGAVSSASCVTESSADLSWGEMEPAPGVTWSPPRTKRPALLLLFVGNTGGG